MSLETVSTELTAHSRQCPALRHCLGNVFCVPAQQAERVLQLPDLPYHLHDGLLPLPSQTLHAHVETEG